MLNIPIVERVRWEGGVCGCCSVMGPVIEPARDVGGLDG